MARYVPFHMMRKMSDIAPSTDTIFFRGVSSRKKPEEVREYLEDEAGCKLIVEFTKVDELQRKLFIALKFPTRDLAKDILDKYDNQIFMGDRVTVSWFKDLRKLRATGQYNNNSRPGYFNRDRNWGNTNRRFSDQRSPYRERYRRSRSFSRSRSRSKSRSQKRSSSAASSKSSGSVRKLVRSTAVRRESSDDPSMMKDRFESPRKASKERRVINLAKPRTTPDHMDLDELEEKHKSKERFKELSRERKKRSHSSDSDSKHSDGENGLESVAAKKEELKEIRKSKKRKHRNGSKKKAKAGVGEALSDGEIDSNRSIHSQGPASPPYEGDLDSFNNIPTDYDVDKILEANEAITARNEAKEAFKQETSSSNVFRAPADHGDGIDALLSMTLKTEKAGPPKAGITADQMMLIRDKKDDLERAYKTDCETFVMVCKMLISKDASLEDRILPSLRENLKEIGQRCILELREFMERIQGEATYRVF